jgi:putative transposase
MIKALTTEYDVQEMCEALSVSTSGYYDWLDRKPSKRQKSDQVLSEQIRAVHAASRKTYGRPRITLTLQDQGQRCSPKRVARLMRQNGLQGAQKARYKPKTTDSNHDLPISPNRLAELPTVDRINQVWVGDITYIPTLEGWMYLAAFMDLKSRKIKGWTIRDHMQTSLVNDAFSRAVFREGPVPGLITHTDRGCQYASRAFQALLSQHHVLSSMSAKGNCYDNAAMESFWATLKTDMRIVKPFKTKEDARRAIFDYIETFYNRFRLHSALGCSPLDYENKLVA